MRSLLSARSLAQVLLLAFVLSAPAAAEPAPEPVSVRALFANPVFSSPRLSPDGTRVAAIHSHGDVQHVAVRDPGSERLDPLVRIKDPQARLAWIAWANDERLLLSAQQRHPAARDPRRGMVARQSLLYGIGLEARELRQLSGGAYFLSRLGQYQDRVLHWLPDDPRQVLIAHQPAHMSRPSVARLDVETGDASVVEPPAHGIVSWHVDSAGRVRAGEAFREKRYALWARVGASGEFVRLAERAGLDDHGIRFAGFHADPAKLYVMQPHDGRSAVFEFDIASGKLGALVFAHPEVDVSGILCDVGPGLRPIGVRFTLDRDEVHYFDDAAALEQGALARSFAREFARPVRHSAVSATRDGTQQLLSVSSDTQPPVYYYFNRTSRRLTRFLDERPGIDTNRLSPTERRTYRARDGLEIPAYLTLPRTGSPKPAALIVMPHGGPWARDDIRWNPEVQLFASRGFAVLQMNYRGSTGHGAAHLAAGFREWGQKIQDDITDGVSWAIAEGIADPDRVGIYGGSFGGYAALAGLVKTPTLYRAGAAYAAVTDIEHLIEDDDFYRSYVDVHEARIGGEAGDQKRLRASSPLRRASEVRAPVLLGHGEHDQRVHVHQSRRMAAALRKAGKDVEYLEFPDEIHGFLLEANRLRWYEALVAFFEKNLAPRAAPPAAAP